MRKPISITIGAENLLWLKGQAGASDAGTVSGVIDALITDARRQGRTHPGAVRSVKGAIRIPDDDPDLTRAKADVRLLFEQSLSRVAPDPARARPARHVRRARG